MGIDLLYLVALPSKMCKLQISSTYVNSLQSEACAIVYLLKHQTSI